MIHDRAEAIRQVARSTEVATIRERHGVRLDPHEDFSFAPQGAYGGGGASDGGAYSQGGGGGSWNSQHPSNGCSQPNLVATGGSGRFYCFAAN